MFSKKYIYPLFRCFSTRKLNWEPWEDQVIKDYIKHNGTKWRSLSEHCLPNRLPRQCQSRWDAINPEYKQGPFSSYERQLLQQGVEKYGNSFSIIHKELLPNRAPRRIAHEWYNSGGIIEKKNWTEEEDQLLMKGISHFGLKNWTKIQRTYLPEKKRSQIRFRYLNTLDPSLKKEKTLSQEELDTILKRTIIFGQDWKKVAEGLPGRTPERCAEAWYNGLDPSLIKGPWSKADTRLLWELLYLFDGAFHKAAEYLPGQNFKTCNTKFRSEIKPLLLLYPEQTKQKKEESKKDWIKRMASLLREKADENTELRLKSNGDVELHQIRNWSEKESKYLEQLINDKLTSKDDKLNNADWKEIASHFTGRDFRQCRYRYIEYIKNKDTNKGTWSKEEDDLLKELVNQHGTKWQVISEKLKSRSPRQCSYRWHRVLEHHNTITDERLTDQEKLLIKEGVLMFGNNWKAISATYLPHRTPHQCMRWWNYQHKKNNSLEDEEIPIKSEQNRWTEAQDKALSVIVSGYEKDGRKIPWPKIASMIDGRTSTECKIHWLYSLKPDLGKRWTYDEEMQLLEIVQELKSTDSKNIWPTVAKKLNTGRDDWQCRRKFNYMQRAGNRFAI